MANKECDIDRKDVRYCFKSVEKLIKALPVEIFRGDSALAKKLADKKECADAGLVYLDEFFNKWKDITKDEIDEFTGVKDKWKGILDMVCGRQFPTINPPEEPE
jgi:hypothetical protein